MCSCLLPRIFAPEVNKKGVDNEKIISKNLKTEEYECSTFNQSRFLTRVANYEANPNEWKFLGERPALIDFYATWCGPCKMLAPVLDELADEYAGQVDIYKVNVDEEEELAALFGIRSVPSLLFVPMNGTPQMAQGALPKKNLKDAIQNVLLKND